MPEEAPVGELGALSVSGPEEQAPRTMAPMRGPRSLLAVVRHAEEGAAPEPTTARLSAADVIAETEAGEDADGEVEKPPQLPVEDPGEGNRPLGPTGDVQATGLGIELSSILVGFGSTHARICHAPTLSSAQSAERIAAQLRDEGALGNQRLSVEVVEVAELDSQGDPLKVKNVIEDSRPPNGIVIVVSQLPLVLKVVEQLGFDAVEEEEFGFACGLLIEYPPSGVENPDEHWELHRNLSHE